MRTLLLVPLAALFGCAHGGARSTGQAAAEPPPAAAPQVAATAPAQVACPLTRVHFAFDSAKLTAVSKATLDRSADCLKSNPQQSVSIQGDTDDRGAEAYNKALGERRAQAVQSYLASKGVSKIQMSTFTFGEDNPLCTQDDEECWKRNRRAAIQPSCRIM